MTANDVLEQAADPLDPVIADLESVVLRLRDAAEPGDGPAALDARAAAVRRLADDLTRLPLRLLDEANTCDAAAAAMRAAGEASAVLAEAAAAAEDAEAAYTRTGTPEQSAAGRVTSGRQLAEEAADQLAQAEQGNAEPAALASLHGSVRDAQAVLEHEVVKLSEAQQGRQAAKDALDRARAAHRKAEEDLAAAEEAAVHPTAASLSRNDLFEPLMFAFPAVLFGEEELTADQMAVCRYHACAIVDDFNWTPPRAEARIRAAIAREMAATARRGHAVEIRDDRGTLRLRADPLGMAGAGGPADPGPAVAGAEDRQLPGQPGTARTTTRRPGGGRGHRARCRRTAAGGPGGSAVAGQPAGGGAGA